MAGVVLLNTLLRGMQAEMQNTVIDSLNGHVKVLQPGYRADPGIQRGFEIAQGWDAGLPAEAIAGWAARVRVPAVIMSERETRGIQLVGIDPGARGHLFPGPGELHGRALSGPEDRRVIIGGELAEQLETAVGRRLVLVTQGADGRNREAGYRIAGIFEAEAGGLEKAFVFTGADTLQDMLDTLVVTEVSIRLADDVFETSIIDRLLGVFAGLDVLSWKELEPQAASMVAFADNAIFIYFLVIMGALVFGLVNTLVTAVMERVRELGMLRALGMRPRSVVAQVVMESSLIMFVGVAVGVVIAAGAFSLMADGIDLSAFNESLATFGMRPTFVPVLRVDDVILVVAMSLLLGIVASFYPARRAVQQKPLDALRR